MINSSSYSILSRYITSFPWWSICSRYTVEFTVCLSVSYYVGGQEVMATSFFLLFAPPTKIELSVFIPPGKLKLKGLLFDGYPLKTNIPLSWENLQLLSFWMKQSPSSHLVITFLGGSFFTVDDKDLHSEKPTPGIVWNDYQRVMP